MSLFPDYLFEYALPERIIFNSLERRGDAFTFGPGLFVLDREASLEEQVAALTHELVHYHPNFVAYTDALLFEDYSRNEAFEKSIELHAHLALEEVSGLRETLRKIVLKARELYERDELRLHSQHRNSHSSLSKEDTSQTSSEAWFG